MSASVNREEYLHKYGPWAVITGASDGTGAAFARDLAAIGINLVLIARTQSKLDAFAAELKTAHGIETRTASVDLYKPGGGAQVLAAADGLEVGLFISNAGADTNGSRFLDAPVSAWMDLVQRNVAAVVEATYGFAKGMRERKRGGIILMSSGAAMGGAPGVAVYGATKAFDLNFAEGLWTELKSHGVDVLSAVCPAMDTPSFQRFIKKQGVEFSGAFNPEDVSRDLIERLPDGPTRIFGFGPEAENAPAQEKARRERAIMMVEVSKMFMKGE